MRIYLFILLFILIPARIFSGLAYYSTSMPGYYQRKSILDIRNRDVNEILERDKEREKLQKTLDAQSIDVDLYKKSDLEKMIDFDFD